MQPIRAIKQGECILGYDITAGISVFTKVLEVIVHDGDDYCLNELHVGGVEIIEVTDGHPIFDGERWLLSHVLDSKGVLSLHEDYARRAPCIILRRDLAVRSVYNLITETGTFLVGEMKVVASGTIDVSCPRASRQ